MAGWLLTLAMPPAQAERETFVSATGRGARDGASFENAAAAAGDGLQRAWDALAPGGTLWLAAEEYPGVDLTIRPASGAGVRTLRGQVVENRRPLLRGRFDPNQPERTQDTAITVMEGASHWAVRDLDFRRIGTAIHARGGNEEVVVHGLRIFEAREGIRIEGRGKAARDSQQIVIGDCRFEHFTKKGVRLCPGTRDARIERCVADAGGREWMKEKFHIGFFVDGDCDRIVFADCEARGSHDEAGKGYWNADGFCVERAGHVRWERCRAFDCTDGGWDSKAARSELSDCVAARNKRNFRFWGGAKLTNCLSVFPKHPGGSGGELTLWTSGAVEAVRCTFVGTSLLETSDGGTIQMDRSLLVRLGNSAAGEKVEGLSLRDCRETAVAETKLADLFRKPDPAAESGAGFQPHDRRYGFLIP